MNAQGKWDWRSQPLEHMSLPQLAVLADEGNEDAAAIVQRWLDRAAARRPVAERLDNYGRVKVTQ